MFKVRWNPLNLLLCLLGFQPSSRVSVLLVFPKCLSDGLNHFISVSKNFQSVSFTSPARNSKPGFGFTSKNLQQVCSLAFISECKQKDNKLSGVTGMTPRLSCPRLLPGIGPRWKTRGQSRAKNGALSPADPSHQLGLNELKGGNST